MKSTLVGSTNDPYTTMEDIHEALNKAIKGKDVRTITPVTRDGYTSGFIILHK